MQKIPVVSDQNTILIQMNADEWRGAGTRKLPQDIARRILRLTSGVYKIGHTISGLGPCDLPIVTDGHVKF